MPEGPELNKAAKLVNAVCKGRVFHGKIVKSIVNYKNPEILLNFSDYTVQAESRGKEMALIVSSFHKDKKTAKNKMNTDCKNLRILFRFGMSGKFQFTSPADVHKHAHLSFFTKDKPPMVLSFVDVRRFGRWEINDGWSSNRGPDPILEYPAFRENVLNNLEHSDFNKPLCEVMHNQKYFNGIGNYLRAEIIYRTGIPPFSLARDVLSSLKIKKENKDIKESCKQDLLQLCNMVPNEVLQLSGAGYDPSGAHSDYSAFMNWLQCYSNHAMSNLVDHDGRTMWFKGPAGPLAPKGAKSRSKPYQGKRSRQSNDEPVIKKEPGVAPPNKKTKTTKKIKKGKREGIKAKKNGKEAKIATKTSKTAAMKVQAQKTRKTADVGVKNLRRSSRIATRQRK